MNGISIVCVFNDEPVRRECLDQSIAAFDGPEAAIEYLPIDNRRGQFSSAGAALNHGTRIARYDVVVLVHQDVALHALEPLENAARHLRNGNWGILGASGAAFDGRHKGFMRDRVVLKGDSAPDPVEVDTLDEVLLMALREQLLAEPLVEAPDLAWHAYGVEYCLRMRQRGLKAGALNLAITHNSMSINLDRLEVAHERVAALYPEALPIRTTCGVIGGKAWRSYLPPSLDRNRWRARWLAKSLLAWRMSRNLPSIRCVLSDIKVDVDLLGKTEKPLHVVNLDPSGDFSFDHARTEMRRNDRRVIFSCVGDVSELAGVMRGLNNDDSVLVTNLKSADFQNNKVSECVQGRDAIFGLNDDVIWLLVGPIVHHLPQAWSDHRAVPLGMEPVHLAS